MHIFYVAAEAAPIIKIGGLGDVAGSLPKALKRSGVDVTIILPHYDAIDQTKFPAQPIGSIDVEIGENSALEAVAVQRTLLPNSEVPVILLGNKKFLAGGGISSFENTHTETDRFAFFAKAIATLLTDHTLIDQIGLPDIIHCNDWHASLIPIFLKGMTWPAHSAAPPCVLTIHNVTYQGVDDYQFCDRFGLNEVQRLSLSLDGPKHDINFLKQGITQAALINTVSENYAKELLTDQFCAGLCDVFQARQKDLSGILNGIDYDIWNPRTDPLIEQRYPNKQFSQSDLQAVKAKNRAALLEIAHLPHSDKPIVGFIGRIEPKQKGIDLLANWLTESNHNQPTPNCQVIILGTGDKSWEDKLKAMQALRREWLSVNILFSEQFAHAMYAGCDYILMPSKFEPGGLPQMIGQHYGTLPIVHAVGGLKDSVIDGLTGFHFTDYTTQSMVSGIQRALDVFEQDSYWQMALEATQQDFSWDRSGAKYLTFYKRAILKK